MHKLHEAGFVIWPFDYATMDRSAVVEIYPRAWTGAVKVSRFEERRDFLAGAGYRRLSESMRNKATTTEDAFDAAVSALGMDADRGELSALPRINDPQLRMEGIIWQPNWRQVVGP